MKLNLVLLAVVFFFFEFSNASLPIVRCSELNALSIDSDVEVYELEDVEVLNIPTVDCDKTSVCRLDCKHYGGSGVVIISLEQFLQTSDPRYQQIFNL
jgi:hypothetical protein